MDITIVVSWTSKKERIAKGSIGQGQFGDTSQEAAVPLSNALGVGQVV